MLLGIMLATSLVLILCVVFSKYIFGVPIFVMPKERPYTLSGITSILGLLFAVLGYLDYSPAVKEKNEFEVQQYFTAKGKIDSSSITVTSDNYGEYMVRYNIENVGEVPIKTRVDVVFLYHTTLTDDGSMLNTEFGSKFNKISETEYVPYLIPQNQTIEAIQLYTLPKSSTDNLKETNATCIYSVHSFTPVLDMLDKKIEVKDSYINYTDMIVSETRDERLSIETVNKFCSTNINTLKELAVAVYNKDRNSEEALELLHDLYPIRLVLIQPKLDDIIKKYD